jgi:hypothetical protein
MQMAPLILVTAVIGGLALIRFVLVAFNYWRFALLDLEYPVPLRIAVEHAHTVGRLCEIAGTPRVCISLRNGRLRVMCEFRGVTQSRVQDVRDLMAIAELMFGATVAYKPAGGFAPCDLPPSAEFIAKLQESVAEEDDAECDDDWDSLEDEQEAA